MLPLWIKDDTDGEEHLQRKLHDFLLDLSSKNAKGRAPDPVDSGCTGRT